MTHLYFYGKQKHEGKWFELVEAILCLIPDVSIPAWLILFQQLCHLRLSLQHFQQTTRYWAGLHSDGRLLVEKSGITGNICFSQNQFPIGREKRSVCGQYKIARICVY